MARLVVLEFPDNDEAEEFVDRFARFKEHEPPVVFGQGGAVVGLFAMPTQFCPSSGVGGCSSGKRIKAWARGKKYGWWVCIKCGKPSNFSGRNAKELWRRVVSQGVNLLKSPEEQDPESVHDEGWGIFSHH